MVKCSCLFSLKTDKNLHMDNFEVKMPAVSSTKKSSSHLLPNLTAHDLARTYSECTLHVDDGQMFCSSSSCNISCLKESPLIFNYCLQGERLLCCVQASFVIQYYHEIRCEFDRLAYGIN